MIQDSELLEMLMKKYPEGDAAFIMNEFAAYRQKLAALENADTAPAQSAPADEETKQAKAQTAAPKVQKLTKRQLKYSPEESITMTDIQCCICGQRFKKLNAKHLAKHNTTPEEYTRVCGFEKGTPLMGKMVYEKLVSTAKDALAAKKRMQAMIGGIEDL